MVPQELLMIIQNMNGVKKLLKKIAETAAVARKGGSG